MLFTQEAVSGLADGSITLTFRTWTKPQAKVGGRYRTWGLLLEVDSVARVELALISDPDARRAGYASAGDLRGAFERQGHDDGEVWRVAFRCVGADDRIARRNNSALDAETQKTIETRLARLDKASGAGPWTRNTLELIAARPGVVSTTLARQLKMERAAFKVNVRKLKELGLTESLEVGYRLSKLGEAFMNRAALRVP
jgi:biotin operon repressor